MTGGSPRHLSPSILSDHVEAGITIVYPFPGEPRLDLIIEGAVPRLTLRAPLDSSPVLTPSALKNVAIRSTYADGGYRLEVSVSGADLILDGHAMLCAIADRVQLDGRPPIDATTETLDQWRSMIALRSRMTPETEVGLFGELLIVKALVEAGGAEQLPAWRGPYLEEHDLGMQHVDVEIKTTTAEQRVHWISSLDQLHPSPGRPLYLISVQITRGGAAGRTLPELIGEVGALVDPGPLGELLEHAGWGAESADLFVDRWHLRSSPTSYLVDGQFPALSRELLSAIPRNTSRISDVRYRIDLGDMTPEPVTDAILAPALSALSND